jgi:uncharacterized protein YxjI
MEFEQREFIIEQKFIALQDTYVIRDKIGNQLGIVKKKLISVTSAFTVEDNTDILAEIRAQFLTLHDTFRILDREGKLVAKINKKIFKIFSSAFWIEDSNKNKLYWIEGNFSKHDYMFKDMNKNVVAIVHKKWATLRDSYCLEITGEIDPLLAICSCIAIDQKLEGLLVKQRYSPV